MTEPTFNLFGPITKNDIKVGYVSTERGYQTGVSVCDANDYAKKNPGTTFIFKPDRKTVRFLNINQLNALAANPANATLDTACSDGFNMNATPERTKVVFMGGGGVGAVANPVIGDDGAVLAIDLVNGGFGYKYPPIVDIHDDAGIGAGAVVKVDVGEIEEQMIYYTDKEDFEEYEICPSPLPKDLYGRRYGPDGKDIGEWTPKAYTDGEIPFSDVVDAYIEKVQEAGKDWWTTRKFPPLAVTSTGQTTKAFYKVKHPAWGAPEGFMDTYAISPVPPSNVKGSDHSGKWYTFEWNVDFPYDGEYVFHTARDNKSRLYIDNVPFTDRLQTFTGTNLASGKVGKKGGFGNKLTLKKGSKVLRLDLYNEPQYKKVAVQQPPPAATSSIDFKITTGSMFSNGVVIKELDIDEIKPFTPPKMGKKGQLNVTHTRKVEFGKKYKVVFSSKGREGSQGWIKYTNLNASNSPIRVSGDSKRIELKDDDGDDTNFALQVDSGKAKFSADGKRLMGSGNITLTASWRDKGRGRYVAVDSVQIGDKVWRRKGVSGSQTHTVALASGSAQPSIRLRTKGSNVIQMEDWTDNDWTDLIVTASGGQFTDLKGNIAYFSVPYPPKSTGKSTQSEGKQTREIFNTVDYINKANRQLWRTNVYARGGFLNDFGVCPFDTKLQLKDNPYAGTHKIVWPNVNFPIDGNYTIDVAVDDSVELSIGNQVKIDKKGFSDGVSTGTLRTTRFIKQGNHNIIADLYQIPGGAFGFKAHDGKKKTLVNFNVWVGGHFGNRMTIPGLFSVGKDHIQAGGVGNRMNQEKEVIVGKEYDVIITSIRTAGGRAETQHRKGAIRFRKTKDGSGGLGNMGPRLEFEDKLAGPGDWNLIQAVVSQGRFYNINGNRCKFMVGESVKGINPMGLAINIETEFTEKEVKRERSWNENPMGVALTIDAPLPPTPQQPVPQAEGRCPDNPFWTTRFPGAKNAWYPVRFDAWGKMMNDCAISPLPPDDEGDARNDSGSFTNTWTKSFPYGGFYKVIMAADNWGELWIDDKKVLDMGKGSGTSTFIDSVEKMVYIDGPASPEQEPVTHEIKVVVENEKSLKTKIIDAKVFNTLDWISGGTAKATKKRVNFKITTQAGFANGIHIPELGIFASKRYNGPQINQNFERDVEVNKIYEVEVTSTQSRDGVRLRNRGESVLEMEEFKDNDWKDLVCGATEGRFFDFKPGPNKATCKYMVTSTTKVSGGVSGSTTREGVTYEGPHLFHYQDSRWGKLLNQSSVSPIGSTTQSLSDPNDNILGWKILKWNNVDFPETGKYDITFVADNMGKLFINDKEVIAANPNPKINTLNPTSVEISKGKHTVRIELFNANHEHRKDATENDKRFLSNPTGATLKITRKTAIGTGQYRPWSVNPMGISVKLIPPPCPKKVKGKGKVINPIVTDPGNGYKKPEGGGYPVLLKIKDAVIKDPGINYDCKVDKIRLEPSMGSELQLVCGPFGKIAKVNVINPGLGFTRVPAVIVDTDTGVNLDIALQFESEIAPFDVPDVIQVTDLVGLKQTGYYKGKPYYGAVFYENGVKYSGWYRTAGELVQVYDTMQESIDAQVTTPPSAILRQGSDTSSNDPRLNIPGTPENLT